jgi:hypothetical protein
MTIKEASDLIDAERSGETPDGPATPKQMAMLRALAGTAKLDDLPVSSPMRREAATGIGSLRGYVQARQRRNNETLSVAAMRVCNPHRSPVGINR